MRWLIAGLAALALTACGDSQAGRGPVVLAPSSMQEALTAAAEVWTAQGHAPPVLAFAGTPALARQLLEGAPADLFISADDEWMDRLAEAGRIDRRSRADLAGNRLVLVAPVGRIDTVELQRGALADALGDSRLAMADPASVPAGRYGKAALETLALWPVVQGRITASENVRAALALVERGEARLGLVYASDAQASNKVAVVARIPETSHPPIRYPVALVAGSAHADAAPFLAFLLSPEGRKVFLGHGFIVP